MSSEHEWYKAAYYNGSGSTDYDYPTGTQTTPSDDLVEPNDPGNHVIIRSGRGLRGGAFYESDASEPRASYPRAKLKAWEWRDIGFRISVVPELACLAVRALGGLGLLQPRR